MSVWVWVVLALIALRAVLVVLIVAPPPVHRDTAPTHVDPCLGRMFASPLPPVSAEGSLSSAVRAGRISRDEYRRRMSELAAEDERRHPFVLPPLW